MEDKKLLREKSCSGKRSGESSLISSESEETEIVLSGSGEFSLVVLLESEEIETGLSGRSMFSRVLSESVEFMSEIGLSSRDTERVLSG